MGKFFSDAVETALRYIYYDNRVGGRRGREGFELLVQAGAEGDGDADCILARCLNGGQYVWKGHNFPEDGQRAMKLLHRSIERGSALGILVAKRSGAFTPVWQRKAPISLQEAFQQVLDKAAGGDAFCQYTIGNVYFWWDFVSIEGRGRESFPDDPSYKAYITENIKKCEDWFWRAFRGGMYLAGNNLYHYYSNGDGGYVAPQPEKAEGIYREGAELGYPLHQMWHGADLCQEGDLKAGMQLLLKAAQNGQPGIWYRVADAYQRGEGLEQDLEKAFECFWKSMEEGSADGYGAVGQFYFMGKGVPQDRAKAFGYLKRYSEQEDDGYYDSYLAQCYLEGLGTAPDYQKAYRLAWDKKEEERSLYVLGRIYCEGLGMPQDIAAGVDFLDRASSVLEAREERKRYKKTLFGRWKRIGG